MQTMRYINLLDSVSRVKTSKCFNYNSMIIFAVPKSFVSRAIGQGAVNIRNMQQVLGKKIRIISEAEGNSDAERFINDIVNPIKFKSLEIRDNEMILTSGSMQNKAGLMGRNKTRLDELSLIVKNIFNLDLKLL